MIDGESLVNPKPDILSPLSRTTVPLKMADVEPPLVSTRNLVGSVIRPKSDKILSDHLSSTSELMIKVRREMPFSSSMKIIESLLKAGHPSLLTNGTLKQGKSTML